MSTFSPMPRCIERVVLPLAAALLLAVAPGCRDGGPAPAPEARPLTVLYTCDTQGYIFPCECEGGNEGGIARRAHYLGELPAGPRILVDAGDFTAGGRDWEVLQARFILRGYARMGYHAVNLGHREARLAPEVLASFREECDRLVSANLVDAKGEPVVAPYVVVALEDGTRVGIIGVMDDSLPARELGKGLALLPPDTALGRYLPELRKKSDVVVLLAFADEETMLNLANLFYEINVAVGGRVKQSSAKALTLNQAVGVAITDKGKKIGRLELDVAGGVVRARTNTVVALTKAVPDEVRAAAIQKAYEAALKERAFTPKKTFVDDHEGLSDINARQPAKESK
jgi:2',3'-cyclic-nucleotide 2'-phosphodiesterase (5'-nucleotidase family)